MLIKITIREVDLKPELAQVIVYVSDFAPNAHSAYSSDLIKVDAVQVPLIYHDIRS
jgi:hypothetical protein